MELTSWIVYAVEITLGKNGLTRSIEHHQDSMNRDCNALKATEHTKDCHRQLSWLYPETLAILP